MIFKYLSLSFFACILQDFNLASQSIFLIRNREKISLFRKGFKEEIITNFRVGKKGMTFKLTIREVVLLILCLILVGVISVGVYQFFSSQEHHGLTIVSMELTHKEEQSDFQLTVTVQNTGSMEIEEAELNLVFIKDNDIADSEKQSIDLGPSLTGTFTATFPQILFETGSTYKAIATIYLDDMLLDTKTITKQF